MNNNNIHTTSTIHIHTHQHIHQPPVVSIFCFSVCFTICHCCSMFNVYICQSNLCKLYFLLGTFAVPTDEAKTKSRKERRKKNSHTQTNIQLKKLKRDCNNFKRHRNTRNGQKRSYCRTFNQTHDLSLPLRQRTMIFGIHKKKNPAPFICCVTLASSKFLSGFDCFIYSRHFRYLK